MDRTPRLSKTGIEYGDYAWNFASGCGNNTDGKCNSGGFNCWAYPITQRFAERYPNGFNPTIYPEALLSPLHLKKPSRILCAFMGDLFTDCPEFDPDRIIDIKTDTGFVDHDTLKAWVYNAVQHCPQHTFIFLTKQPQNLIKFSSFPDNAWVGVSITDGYSDMLVPFKGVKAKLKFISFEPLLKWASWASSDMIMRSLKDAGIQWVIIGSQTNPYKPPKIEWVREIVEACDKAGIKVFLKENLRPLIIENWDKPEIAHLIYHAGTLFSGVVQLRQELPHE